MKPVWLGASWAAWRHGIIAGALLGLLGAVLCALPQAAPLQENVDLQLLFRLRGSMPVPADVVLIAIDPPSAERLSLPKDPAARDRCADLRIGRVPDTHEPLPPAHLVVRWPRCMHALAVRALTAGGRERDCARHLVSSAPRQRLGGRCKISRRAGSHARAGHRRRAQRAGRAVARSDRERRHRASACPGELRDRIGGARCCAAALDVRTGMGASTASPSSAKKKCRSRVCRCSRSISPQLICTPMSMPICTGCSRKSVRKTPSCCRETPQSCSRKRRCKPLRSPCAICCAPILRS